jgi:hypothetical protein
MHSKVAELRIARHNAAREPLGESQLLAEHVVLAQSPCINMQLGTTEFTSSGIQGLKLSNLNALTRQFGCWFPILKTHACALGNVHSIHTFYFVFFFFFFFFLELANFFFVLLFPWRRLSMMYTSVLDDDEVSTWVFMDGEVGVRVSGLISSKTGKKPAGKI